MKRKRQKTKFEKFQDAVNAFFGKFTFGIDYWALGLFGVLMLPNIVWWCFSPANDVLRYINSPAALDVFSYIFQALTLAVLVFVVRRDRVGQKVEPWTAFFTFTVMSLILYYVAWIFYFCAYVNIAVVLFLAIFPCTALGCFAFLRKNWIALFPLVIFTALHLSFAIPIAVALV